MSVSGPGLKRLTKLKQKKYREQERLFLAEGASLVGESGPPVQRFDDERSVARLSSLATPTGPVGVYEFLDVGVRELLESRRRLVVLHGVQDPGNVGTIIRSAHAFEAGVVLSRGCTDLYNPKTVRATMGSLFKVPIAREVETPEFLREARCSGFRSVAAVAPTAAPVVVARSGVGIESVGDSLGVEKVAFVVGAEGVGLPDEVVRACDERVRIPAEVHSLNAAVAASILLHAAYSAVLT